MNGDMTCKEKILSNDYIDLVTNLLQVQYNYEITADYCFHVVDGELAVVYLNREDYLQNEQLEIPYSVMPKVYGLMQQSTPVDFSQNPDNSLAFLDAGILQVKEKPLALTGRQVIIGFIDTGIQYENPAFRKINGESRILAIWDQTIQSGMPPEGFLYGTEYTKSQIEEALRSENPYAYVASRDENGHGTAMASVAAGYVEQFTEDGSENRSNLGVANDAELVVVKLKESKEYLRNYYSIQEDAPCYQENDIILALQYLQKFARLLYRPLVICLGIGTSFGDHSGGSFLNRYLDRLALQKSRGFVVANGNEGNYSHHFRGIFANEEQFMDVELRVSEQCSGFTLNFWGKVPYDFQITVKSPSGERKRIETNLPFSSYQFLFGRTILHVESTLVEQFGGAQFYQLRFISPVNGIWTLQIENTRKAEEAVFDMWLPIQTFLDAEVAFLRADPDITMTDPAYVTNVLSVGAYNVETQGIWQESGRGFSRENEIKPDLAAPGIDLKTVVGARSGTSMAAAVTAGAVALFLQWAVVEQNELYADSNLIRNYFIRGATRQSQYIYPNTQWGYGKLNVEGIFRFIAGF